MQTILKGKMFEKAGISTIVVKKEIKATFFRILLVSCCDHLNARTTSERCSW